MSVFTGTLRLTRLALRRDRIKLPIWFAVIVSLTWATASAALDNVYNTDEKRIEYAFTTAGTTLARIFNGALDGPSPGSVVTGETFLLAAVFIAFMSGFIIIRHTRHNEESGSAELIGSGVVGRHANLTAALIVAILASLAIGAGVFALLLPYEELSVGGSLGLSLGLSAVGIAFAGIAAVAAQLTDSARAASSIVGGAIGISFLLRLIGDSLGSISKDGMSVSALWPSWLSPFGWAYQIYPYTKQRWWVFGLLLVFTLALVAISFLFANRRDIGMGMFASRPGPRHAKANLLSALGLAWRLQCGTLYGWIIIFVILGVVFGRMAEEFGKIISTNEAFQQYITSIGGTGQLADVLFVVLFGLTGIIACGYTLQSLVKMRNEEATGHLEPLLSTSVGRTRWMSAHLLVTFWSLVLLLIVVGVSTALSYIFISNASWSEITRLTTAVFVQLPAVLVFSAGAIALFGLVPRWMTGTAWGAFGFMLLINQVGALLELPQWVMNISPFTHVPSAPSESVALAPLVMLTTVAIVLGLIGIAAFRKRDIMTS